MKPKIKIESHVTRHISALTAEHTLQTSATQHLLLHAAQATFKSISTFLDRILVQPFKREATNPPPQKPAKWLELIALNFRRSLQPENRIGHFPPVVSDQKFSPRGCGHCDWPRIPWNRRKNHAYASQGWWSSAAS